MCLRTVSTARTTVGWMTAPRKGDASVITEATASERWQAMARAMIPPRLCPMMWTGSSGKAAVICSPSLRARKSIPAIGWTLVTRIRLPEAQSHSGISRK